MNGPKENSILKSLYLECVESLKKLADLTEKTLSPQKFDAYYFDLNKSCISAIKHLKYLEKNEELSNYFTFISSCLAFDSNSNHVKWTRNNTQKEGFCTQCSNKRFFLSEGAHNSHSDSLSKVREAVRDTIISANEKISENGMNLVAGLTEIKQIIFEAIILPIRCPQLFSDKQIQWSRILLYGPPGTGKSLLAKSILTDVNNVTFYNVSCADVISSWVGESEKFVKCLFEHAQKQSEKSVIFIDEIDSLCRQRSSSEEGYSRRVKTELLRQMDGVGSSSENIFLLCATNCPWELDSAFIRRFQRCCYVSLPDRDARLKILNSAKSDMKSIDLNDEDLKIISDKTEGFSGSDIERLIRNAYFENLRSMMSSKYWKRRDDNYWLPCEKSDNTAFYISVDSLPPAKILPKKLKLAEFLVSLTKIHPTVQEEDKQMYEEFTKRFG